jgi:hypothetical protein
LPVKYESSKLKDVKYIDSGNKPKLVLDIPKIISENSNNYSVKTLNN